MYFGEIPNLHSFWNQSEGSENSPQGPRVKRVYLGDRLPSVRMVAQNSVNILTVNEVDELSTRLRMPWFHASLIT